ncbi:prolipoprotein diacylglyceryl transferase [Fangia hongkongensis]|uniref:prolipoprotein diacylglyceryl transferase n=1 Tax=Fangia hongkongensis TaxID=270495 RepID=UPI0003757FBB|nr:prolipoprotein diacylglyceryl transferase [Fangia hongkongensis]MBK2124673.1 prolipoprotein diacylglyceryl transferase [Fangia hongkongensis]
MLIYPEINPVAFSIGPIKVHWYGIMYLIGFAGAWILSLYRCKNTYSPIKKEQVSDMIFYAALGVILGGRIGYMLFYDFSNFVSHPWVIFQVWDGGMSFHGGLIGVVLAIGLFCRKNKCNVFDILDFIAPMVPIGLGAGRLGNFINDELWGRVTDSPFGMIFPTGGPLPRYPSQLLELILEGIVLFLILWILSRKQRPRLFISAHFLLWYGLFRFIAEFFRQPDPQMGYLLFNWMTMGQVLSLPMIIGGLLVLLYVSSQSTQSKGKLCSNT